MGDALSETVIQVEGEFIRLCDLLKLTGLVDSGAQGKHLVASGVVKVDGLVESRKTAKIKAGQLIECPGLKCRTTA